MELPGLEAHLDAMTAAGIRRELASVIAAVSHPETFIRTAAIAALKRAGEGAEAIRDRLRVETDDLVVSDACDALATLRDFESRPRCHRNVSGCVCVKRRSCVPRSSGSSPLREERGTFASSCC